MHKRSHEFGFTLIELLIVVVMLSALAGIGLSLLNPVRQRLIAEDGVKRATVNKLVSALEAYYSGEGAYPPASDFCNPNSILSKTYMSKCPNGEPNGANYVYTSDLSSFGIVVAKSVQDPLARSVQCIKYRSSWQQPMDCSNCTGDSDLCTAAAVTHSYSQCGSRTAIYTISISPTNLCQSGLTAGTFVPWQSSCSAVGATATCVHASCSGNVTNPCDTSFPRTRSTMTYAWECVCQ